MTTKVAIVLYLGPHQKDLESFRCRVGRPDLIGATIYRPQMRKIFTKRLVYHSSHLISLDFESGDRKHEVRGTNCWEDECIMKVI